MGYSIEAIHRELCASSFSNFVKKMFKFQTGHDYIMARHHQLICDALERVARGEVTRLIINIAPRYGKTLLVSQMFPAWGFALNPMSKFLHLSYSGGLVAQNSIAVKSIINSWYYKRLFDTGINRVSKTMQWNTRQGGEFYAVSTLGQITGFGAGLVDFDNEEDNRLDFYKRNNPNGFGGAIVIDDPIKPQDALVESIRESVNLRFETTIRNRVNSRKTPIVIIMQRVHEHDLCGYLLELEPDEWEVLSIPCIYEENGVERALWEDKHTLEELRKIEHANSVVFETQYMQNPTPFEGLLYRPFKTYSEIPSMKGGRRCNYTDTADTGSDFLCSICYIERPEANYITDVLYTKKSMEFTEPEMANMLMRNQTQYCYVESNSGGRTFMRNVEKMSRERGNHKTIFIGKTQRENKMVRIYTKSNEVNNMTIFPEDWQRRFPEFANEIVHARKEGKAAHDDGVDALTGTYEMRTYGRLVNKDKLLQDFL